MCLWFGIPSIRESNKDAFFDSFLGGTKVKFVTSFPDISIRYVSSFPGLHR